MVVLGTRHRTVPLGPLKMPMLGDVAVSDKPRVLGLDHVMRLTFERRRSPDPLLRLPRLVSGSGCVEKGTYAGVPLERSPGCSRPPPAFPGSGPSGPA